MKRKLDYEQAAVHQNKKKSLIFCGRHQSPPSNNVSRETSRGGIKGGGMKTEAFFNRYVTLARQAERAFEKVKEDFPAEIRCNTGCADCCHALFDLTLIEAVYLNTQFHAHIPDDNKKRILEEANRADRQAYKIKREAYTKHQGGVSRADIFEEISGMKVRCPLLNEADTCELYAFRPITCRVYGMPLSIDGTGRTCGLSGFKPKQTYPTINMDVVHRQLHNISRDFVVGIKSKFPKLDEVLAPVSMALLTVYDDEYLGAASREKQPEDNRQQDQNDEQS